MLGFEGFKALQGFRALKFQAPYMTDFFVSEISGIFGLLFFEPCPENLPYVFGLAAPCFPTRGRLSLTRPGPLSDSCRRFSDSLFLIRPPPYGLEKLFKASC